MTPDIFSNDWFIMMRDKYSIVITAIPTLTLAVLKIIAMLHPGVPTDKIRDLLTWKAKEKP